MKPIFCDTGHHRIIHKHKLDNVEISGTITFNCHVPGCKGKYVIGKKKLESKLIKQD